METLLKKAFGHLGGCAILFLETVRYAAAPPYEIGAWIRQLHHLGVRSLSITTITALFTGMVMALQTAYSMAAYGGKIFVGDVVSLSMVRELGPVLPALVISGRVGAGITAEIGSMQVTEQVDAIRALAASPVKKLVVPKVLATVFMLPLLTVLADFIGIIGGLLMAVTQLNQTAQFYMQHVTTALGVKDIASGLGKAVFFGIFISTIACYNGLATRGGADGVGRATTQTVVVASISVLISDFFLTKLFLSF